MELHVCDPTFNQSNDWVVPGALRQPVPQEVVALWDMNFQPCGLGFGTKVSNATRHAIRVPVSDWRAVNRHILFGQSTDEEFWDPSFSFGSQFQI